MKPSLGVLTATLALAAVIGASPASAAEATAIAVPVTHTCKVKKGCTYDVRTVDGTAAAGTDYAAAHTAGYVRKKKTFTTTLIVQTLDDDACEADETFTVHVGITNRRGVFGYDVTQTVSDDDCRPPVVATQPPVVVTQPPVAVTQPPVVVTQTTATGMSQSCDPPVMTGKIVPCVLNLQCPATARACEATGRGRIATEARDRPVSATLTRIWVYAAGGSSKLSDRCDELAECGRAFEKSYVAAGDSMTVECGGSAETPAKLSCFAEFKFL
jgi:hypothetical protein